MDKHDQGPGVSSESKGSPSQPSGELSELRALIPEYLDGELDGDALRRFDGELDAHPELREEVEAARDASELLHQLPQEQLEADVYPAVRQRLRDRAGTREPTVTVTLEVVIAVSLLLFIAAFMLLGRSSGDAPAPACSTEDLRALVRATPTGTPDAVAAKVQGRPEGGTLLTLPPSADLRGMTERIQARGCSIASTSSTRDGSTALVVPSTPMP
jgi:hypothetical protein